MLWDTEYHIVRYSGRGPAKKIYTFECQGWDIEALTQAREWLAANPKPGLIYLAQDREEHGQHVGIHIIGKLQERS